MNDAFEPEFESEFELTSDELTIICRFITQLNSPALQATILGRVDQAHGNSEAQRTAVGNAVEQIAMMCEFKANSTVGYVKAPQDIVNVAPSLALVVAYAAHPPVRSKSRRFGRKPQPTTSPIYEAPKDFIPSDALVGKCLIMHHMIVRAATVPDGNQN